MTQAAEWQTGKIDDVSEKVGIGPFGSSIRVNTFVPNGIPIISGQHLRKVRIDEAPGFNFITQEHAQRLANANVQRSDVVFTYAGNIGQVSYIPADSQFERYVISQRQFYMRCDRSKVIPEYVALYFKSPEGQHKLLANSSQVGVPMIAQPVTYLRSIEIPIPPLPEQRAIAHVLGTLDDKIELNRRLNRTLEEMARAIFQDWFVDFGPTKAMMEGLDPYLPSELWDLFPDQMVDSELGEIPEGWEVKPLETFADIASGKRPKERSPVASKGAQVPLWGGNGPMAFVPDALVDKPILLTGRVGTLGSVFRVTKPCWPSDNTLIVSPKNSLLLNFLYFQMKLIDFYTLNRGSTQPLLTQTDLKSQLIASPPETIIWRFDEITRASFNKIEGCNSENETLASHRDTLLPILVAGEILMLEK